MIQIHLNFNNAGARVSIPWAASCGNQCKYDFSRKAARRRPVDYGVRRCVNAVSLARAANFKGVCRPA